jgi:hypothetical protein
MIALASSPTDSISTPPLRADSAKPPVAATATGPRFTVDGSPELEQHLTLTCARIAAGVRGLIPAGRLEALVLGGGYGRGEGGVWRTADGDRPYNDLEFYVFLRGNRHLNDRRYARSLHVLGEILTPQAGIDVEFKIASRRELERSGVSMFSYDLLSGHRLLIGRPTFFDGAVHHRIGEEIPLEEATRLLMNRASGLLFARERLERARFTPNDADFVARNIAKAQLGGGDAVLTALGQYHWSVRERQRRLERFARVEVDRFTALRRHYAAGVDFKLHPSRSTETRDALAAAHAEIAQLCRQVWLWLEARRLHRSFADPAAYATDHDNKWPSAPGPRNLLVNAKVFGRHAVARGRMFRHPRERVLNALSLLLWHDDLGSTPSLLACVQKELGTSATTFAELVGAYQALWQKVN